MTESMKRKIEYLKKAYKLLRKYPGTSVLVVVFSFFMSVFDGFSIGAIIPFLQQLIGEGSLNKTFDVPWPDFITQGILSGSREDVLLTLLVFALAMIVLKSIFNYLRVVMVHKVRSYVRRDLRNELFNEIADSSLRYYDAMRVGGAVGAVQIYTEGVSNFILMLLSLIGNTSRLIVYAILLFFISWQFTLVAIAFELLVFPVIKKLLVQVKRISHKITVQVEELSAQLVEMFGNLRLIKVFGTEKKEKERFDGLATHLADLQYRDARFFYLVLPVSEVLAMLGIMAFFVISAKILNIDIIPRLPFIIAYLYVFMRLFNEVNRTLRTVSELLRYMEPYKAYERMRRDAYEAREHLGTKPVKSFTKLLEFKDVDFSYNPASPVLEQINFKIKHGSFTAIVGPTGGGKSTIANLIAGLYQPDHGQILVDGQDLHELNTVQWRKLIGYLSQEVTIFNDTAAANIAYGKSRFVQDEIVRAAKVANIHEFIESLPQGYDTTFGDRGAKLSGGQKQRIAIARAIINAPQILMLDEATSSLDIETERAVQEALERVMKNRTVIAIAHRLATIQRADQILFVDQGKIMEQGTHDQLLKRNSNYKKYYQLQLS